ncbi:hypothetical protein WJX81_007107 [Elliptochloris bilobata]|uniref:CRC domain-containing protein n=1 Tax=Elliptochloris bilobata TaxID=381761 RepID=A0AAW1SB57_9CHLO
MYADSEAASARRQAAESALASLDGWVQQGTRGGGARQPPHEVLLGLSRHLRSLAADYELQGADTAGGGTAEQPERVGAASALKSCRCKKSGCLKLYCECFAAGTFCGGGCGCCACLNTVTNAPLVAHVRQAVLERAPLAFMPKVQEAGHRRGCQCRKSRCQKSTGSGTPSEGDPALADDAISPAPVGPRRGSVRRRVLGERQLEGAVKRACGAIQVRDAAAGVPVSWGTAPAVDDALRDCRWAAHKRPPSRAAGAGGVTRAFGSSLNELRLAPGVVASGKRRACVDGDGAPKVAPAEDDAAQALLMLL